jgi:hypothetical protein
VWLGTLEPSPDELTRVPGIFGLHELVMEDAQSFNLRPKVEQHEERRLLRGAAHGALRRHTRGSRVRRDLDLRRTRLRDHACARAWPATSAPSQASTSRRCSSQRRTRPPPSGGRKKRWPPPSQTGARRWSPEDTCSIRPIPAVLGFVEEVPAAATGIHEGTTAIPTLTLVAVPWHRGLSLAGKSTIPR